jgi:predicted DNA-binding transcriptional regulator AlpA
MRTRSILRPAEAGARLGVSSATLKRWAKSGIGPPRLKIGPRAVGYEAEAVDAWIAQCGQRVDAG